MTTLKGIAWDHRRCWGPLDASVAPWRAATGQDVTWDRRSLYSFGEGDLVEFIEDYDLIVYDHPFVGDIAQKGLMWDLAPLLTEADRTAFAADALGRSWDSYHYAGGIWGLPLDAAAQTAAWRPDLMERAGEPVPQTLQEVLALVPRLQARGLQVGWAAKPTDLMCTFLSLSTTLGADPGRGPDGTFVPAEIAEAAIDLLRQLWPLVHPLSHGWNPIRCLDHMAATDEVAYVPWLFNYVNYSTDGRIRFGGPPHLGGGTPGSVLGGAGIGITRSCKEPDAALAYALHLCSPEFQAGPYVGDGGQPGSRRAWTSAEADRITNGFFSATRPVLETAWLRTREPGYVGFFHDATLRITAVVAEGASARDFTDWMNAAFARLAPNTEEARA